MKVRTRRLAASIALLVFAGCGREATVPPNGEREGCVEYRYSVRPVGVDRVPRVRVEIRTVEEGACGGIRSVRALLFDDLDGDGEWTEGGDVAFASSSKHWTEPTDAVMLDLGDAEQGRTVSGGVYLRLEVALADSGPRIFDRLVQPSPSDGS